MRDADDIDSTPAEPTEADSKRIPWIRPQLNSLNAGRAEAGSFGNFDGASSTS
jgi:hypothetical protein